MIDTIIFDLDGTLLNTLDDLAGSINFALGELGCPIRTINEVRNFVGNGVGLLVERALADGKKELKQKCLQIFERHYDANKSNLTRAYDGIHKMLTEVVAAGYKTAIVSNKYDAAVSALKAKEFACIDVAIGERDGLAKKPAPDMVILALEQLGKTKSDAVYVGDSDVDIMTARNSGLKVIAVSWGFRERELLEQMGADIIIDSPAQLLGALQSL